MRLSGLIWTGLACCSVVSQWLCRRRTEQGWARRIDSWPLCKCAHLKLAPGLGPGPGRAGCRCVFSRLPPSLLFCVSPNSMEVRSHLFVEFYKNITGSVHFITTWCECNMKFASLFYMCQQNLLPLPMSISLPQSQYQWSHVPCEGVFSRNYRERCKISKHLLCCYKYHTIQSCYPYLLNHSAAY